MCVRQREIGMTSSTAVFLLSIRMGKEAQFQSAVPVCSSNSKHLAVFPYD